eukprot:716108-Amorphochlora_amoeboformis.AAC.1
MTARHHRCRRLAIISRAVVAWICFASNPVLTEARFLDQGPPNKHPPREEETPLGSGKAAAVGGSLEGEVVEGGEGVEQARYWMPASYRMDLKVRLLKRDGRVSTSLPYLMRLYVNSGNPTPNDTEYISNQLMAREDHYHPKFNTNTQKPYFLLYRTNIRIKSSTPSIAHAEGTPQGTPQTDHQTHTHTHTQTQGQQVGELKEEQGGSWQYIITHARHNHPPMCFK